ncbi:hypothetical protein DERF_004852 [Dermatophagoides farinae]|uniref:Uncharacterized protein n=1 Tax=Dermatophagoides farinae TaxID=6954 RepID=A0A922I2T6_DERFA|nr:hypothetical protein DERF_004852 [Dermatophagoides farinae]
MLVAIFSHKEFVVIVVDVREMFMLLGHSHPHFGPPLLTMVGGGGGGGDGAANY